MATLLSLTAVSAAGQDPIEKLRQQIKRDQEQLKATNALLGKNRDNITLSERELKLVQNNIRTRRTIIGNLDKESSIIMSEIGAITERTKKLNDQLEKLKKEYGEFVYAAWKNHKLNNAVAFLFASKDFNDATRRVSHMKRYNEMRVRKSEQIDSLNRVLQREIEKLTRQKEELASTRAQRNSEISTLAKEEKQQTSTLGALRSDRKKLEAQAKEQQRKIAEAQKQIDRIIAEQNRAKSGRTAAQIEADIILSGRFEDNKGKLPWPVAGGSVIDRFGRHAVSSQQGIVNDFKGINIAAPKGTQVRSVFEGEVTGIYNVGHFNNCVMVRSGSYVILYGNLAAISVKTGDKVALNQQIGRLFDTDDCMLIFQIWKETTPVDPEAWLRR